MFSSFFVSICLPRPFISSCNDSFSFSIFVRTLFNSSISISSISSLTSFSCTFSLNSFLSSQLEHSAIFSFLHSDKILFSSLTSISSDPILLSFSSSFSISSSISSHLWQQFPCIDLIPVIGVSKIFSLGSATPVSLELSSKSNIMVGNSLSGSIVSPMVTKHLTFSKHIGIISSSSIATFSTNSSLMFTSLSSSDAPFTTWSFSIPFSISWLTAASMSSFSSSSSICTSSSSMTPWDSLKLIGIISSSNIKHFSLPTVTLLLFPSSSAFKLSFLTSDLLSSLGILFLLSSLSYSSSENSTFSSLFLLTWPVSPLPDSSSFSSFSSLLTSWFSSSAFNLLPLTSDPLASLAAFLFSSFLLPFSSENSTSSSSLVHSSSLLSFPSLLSVSSSTLPWFSCICSGFLLTTDSTQSSSE